MNPMDAKKTPFKTLIFPWLAHGHVSPFLELSKRLSKTNDFHIYLCSTSIILASIKRSLSKYDNINLIELPLADQENKLPPYYHCTKNIPPHLMPALMKAFQLSKPKFARILNDLSPDLLIYDGFQPWAAKQAKALGIPAVFFATSGAATLSYYHHMHTYRGFDSFPFRGIYLHPYQMMELAAHGESIVVDDAEEGFSFGVLELSCEFVLMKSCGELEGKYMEYLAKLCCKRVVPVGTLMEDGDHVATDGDSDVDIVRWLDGKGPSSTLYISFGSENYLTKDQMVEIAKGLELSNVDFIWVTRSPPEAEEDVIPKEFVDQTKGKGMVVRGWAPQRAILAHPNVGGFMSHCGWNSIMESVYFGVPVVAVPLKLDQPVNCRLIVENGMGVEVGRGADGKFDGEGVAKAIKEVMMESEEMRSRVREMTDKVRMDKACEDAVLELSKLCSTIGATRIC